MTLRGSSFAWVLVLGCGAGGPATKVEEKVEAKIEARAEKVEAKEVEPAGVVAASSKFQLVAFRDGELGLHRLEDDVVVAGGGALARAEGRGPLAAIERGLVGLDDPGELANVWGVVALAGRWPDNAWLVHQAGYERGVSPGAVYRREGEAWAPQLRSKGPLWTYYSHLVDGLGGPVLGLRAHQIDDELFSLYGDEFPAKVKRQVAAAEAADPQRFEVLGPQPTAAPQRLAAGLTPTAAAGAATGELFVLAQRGPSDAQVPVVQRWGTSGAAATKGQVDALPGASTCDALTVRAADEAYAGCAVGEGGLLLRFDGAAWTPEPGPAPETLRSLSVARDGALWAITGKDEAGEEPSAALWRRAARDAAWERVDVPEVRFSDAERAEWHFSVGANEFGVSRGEAGAGSRGWSVEPLQVVARSAEDVWVRGVTRTSRADIDYTPRREVVLRTAPAQEPVRLLGDGDLYLEVLDWRPAREWKAGEGCGDLETAFVALRTLAADAPLDGPEPTVAALVRDHAAALGSVERVVEVSRRGERTLGLVVRAALQEQVDALMKALEAVAPGQPRALECRRPRIRRSFNKATGLPDEGS